MIASMIVDLTETGGYKDTIIQSERLQLARKYLSLRGNQQRYGEKAYQNQLQQSLESPTRMHSPVSHRSADTGPATRPHKLATLATTADPVQLAAAPCAGGKHPQQLPKCHSCYLNVEIGGELFVLHYGSPQEFQDSFLRMCEGAGGEVGQAKTRAALRVLVLEAICRRSRDFVSALDSSIELYCEIRMREIDT